MEDKWERLREIVEQALDKKLNEYGFKQKTKIELLNGHWIGITGDQMTAWRAAFGSLDLDAELKRAAAWIVSNPNLAPKIHSRFLNTWLGRAHDRNSLRSIPTKPQLEKTCAYCERLPVGSVNGIWHCAAHSHDAMDRVQVKKTA